VADIRLEGETRYTTEQVIAASGIDFGTHLFFINEAAAAREIRGTLPYIGQVEIRRQFPNRITIIVDEAATMALFRVENGYLLLDKDARILEHLDSAPFLRLILLYGLSEPLSLRAGETLDFGESDQERLRYLRDILGILSALGIGGEVTMLDLTELHDPEMHFAGRFTVRLGPNRNLHHKLGMLVEIVDYLDDSETGTIDLNPDRPVFRSHPHAVDSVEGPTEE